MLVLTRRQGQYISVTLPSGENFTFHIVQTKGNQCRVGIDAPEGVLIDRGEILLERALRDLREEINATCTDEAFIETWANAPIPAFKDKTAKEITMSSPHQIKDVIEEIKRNYQ